eukprot:CAMPEP_0172156478 /NCGR_PEP_ID=MMETSP1050-20130122/3232_1 /TAXON_ID=233186 /ORGANISM="Cryptomonas curvata, Strain CCAP979/52" /LENGTH=117 /DNA_ID=CAMNT_0012825549 /DNA_START=40 /DNA_END=393 /DNA_ORIENTATION=+
MRAAVLVALVASAAAFSAPSMAGLKLRQSKTAVSMKAETPLSRLPAGVAKALAPAIAFASIAAPAFAEGTGEALGLDDTRLIVPLILVPVIIGIIFQGFAAEQDNDDFFDTYDQRRK